MIRKRQRVSLEIPTSQVALQPQAQPVATRGSGEVPAPILPEILDLAPLSKSLASYVGVTQKQQNHQAGAAGLTAAMNEPALTREQILKKYEGQGAQSPAFWAAHDRYKVEGVVGDYSRILETHLKEFDKVQDPETGYELAPKDPAPMMAEAWKQVSGAYALKNPFGAEHAAELKSKIDQSFMARAQAIELKARETLAYDTMRTGLSSMLHDATWAGLGPVELSGSPDALPATEEQVVRAIETRLTELRKEASVADVRGLLLEAAKSQASTLGETDDDLALRVISIVGDVKVGGVRMADDGQYGGILAELEHKHRERQESSVDRERLKAENALHSERREAEEWYLPAFEKAIDANANLQAEAEKLIDQAQAEGRPPQVFEDIRKYAAQASNLTARTSDPKSLDEIQGLIGMGHLDAAQEAVVNSRDKLTGASVMELMKTIGDRRNIAGMVEGNPAFKSVMDLSASYDLGSDYSEGVRQSNNEQVDFIRQDFNDRAVAYAQSIAGSPNRDAEMRAWFSVNSSNFTKALKELAGTRKTQLDALSNQISVAHSKGVDASGLIEQARSSGLDRNTYDQLLQRNTRATSRGDYLESRDYRMLEKLLDDVSPEQLNMTPGDALLFKLEMSGKLFQDTSAFLDERVGKTEKKDLDKAWLGYLQEQRTGLLKKLGGGTESKAPGASERIRKGAASGDSAADTAAETQALNAYYAAAGILAQKDISRDLTIQNIYGDQMIQADPMVPTEVYEAFVSLANREGGPITILGARQGQTPLSLAINHLDRTVFDAVGKLQAEPDQATVQKSYQALAAMRGLSIPDVLAGKTALVGSKRTDIIDLDLGTLDPFNTTFFGSTKELDMVSKEQPERLTSLLQALSIPEDQAQAWLRMQHRALVRRFGDN